MTGLEKGSTNLSAGSAYPQKLRGAVPIVGAAVLVYDAAIMLAAAVVAYKVYTSGRSCFTCASEGLCSDGFLARAKLTLAFGALGGAILSSRFVILAIRHSKYDARRLPWQVMAPIHSAVLAAIGAAAVQGGLITISTSWKAAEPQYTLFLISFSFLVGLASEPFVKRLMMAAASLFGEKGDLDDDSRESQ
jgi:hypothetical protein